MKKKNIITTLSVITITLIISSILFAKNFSIYQVEGISMEPTLHEGDIVIVQKDSQISDRDIIVCTTERVYLSEDYIIKRYCEPKSSIGLYLLGDNENESIDSRHFGKVPKTSVIGVAILKISIKDGIKAL